MKGTRLDQWLVENGYCETRSRAQAMVLSGVVLVNDTPETKCGYFLKLNDQVRVKTKDHPYVSRGAIKLLHAIKFFNIEVKGAIALDVGASTGGFTEVLLENGALKVHAVDVGKEQLAWKIRNHPQVKVYEELHAKDITVETLGVRPNFLVIDVSFISLTKIMGALVSVSARPAKWVALIKPQFEVGRLDVGKGGVVRDEEAKKRAVNEVIRFGESLGLSLVGVEKSPILGGSAKTKEDGNEEYLAYWELHEKNDNN